MLKKKIAGSLLAVLAVVALALPVMASSVGEYYWPWQMLCRSATSTSTATASLEAYTNNNVILDRIICSSASPDAEVCIYTSTRESTAFSTTQTLVASFELFPDKATREVIVIGGEHPEIPLWIGDKGQRITVKMINSGSKSQMILNGRRGTMPVENPSTSTGY